MPSVLIRNATILTMDPTLGMKYNCDILVVDGRISSIASRLPTSGANDVIDATNCLVTPGFINTHQHCWQHILRGLGTDWHVTDYFHHMRKVYSSTFTAEDVYISSYVAALDMINNGVTTVVDHCDVLNTPHHTDAAIRALKDAGIRGTFCYDFHENPTAFQGSFPEQGTFDQNARRLDAERARKQYFGAKNDPEEDIITFGGAPRMTSQPMEKTAEELKFFRRLGARIITAHVTTGKNTSGGRVIEELGKAGLLGRDMLLSHCANSTSSELSLIKKASASISATPETELQMGMGHPIAFKAKDKGCHVGLGTDTSSTNSSDMLAAMRLILQAERGRADAALRAKRPDIYFCPPNVARPSIEALELATIGGAKALRLDHLIGTICLGKRADLVVTRCDTLNMVPFTNPVGALLFHAHPGNIEAVLVDGKILKRDGQLVGIEWPFLREDIKQRCARILQAHADVMAARASSNYNQDLAVQSAAWEG